MALDLSPNWWLSDGTNELPVTDTIDYGVFNGQHQPYWKSAPAPDGTAVGVSSNGYTRRRRWIIRACCVGLSVTVMLLLIGALITTLILYYTVPSCQCPPETTCSAPATNPAPLQSSLSPSIFLTVDSITYQNNQQVVIDEGSHVLQCTARNVPSGTTLTWDFSEVDVQTSIVQTETRTDGTGGLEDVTSTVYVESIESRLDLDNTLMCTTVERVVATTGRRKRQTLNLFIEIILEVIEQIIASELSLSIDSTLQTDGSTITLTEGQHTFDCYGINPRPDAVIIWVFGSNPVPPNIASVLWSGGGEIRSMISGLEITADYCGIQLTCAVVSWRNPSTVLDSLSITANLLVNTGPSSTVLTPVLASSLDPTGVFATVTEGVAAEFQCETFGTNLVSADVEFTLHNADGTTDANTFSGTTASDLSCSPTSFTRTVSKIPTFDDNHGQRLECVASNDAGSTEVSYIILDVQVPPSSTNDGTIGLRLFIDNTSYDDNTVAFVTPGAHRLECITGYSRPVSSVKWTFGGTDNVLSEDVHSTSQNGPLTSYRSIILAQDVTITDCNNVLVCEATNEALSGSETAPSISVTLKVNAPPTAATISVTGTGSSFDDSTQEATLLPSASYTFTCEVDGADEEPKVTWTLTLASDPDNPSQETDAASSSSVDCVVGGHSETFALTLTDFDEHNGQTLTCAAENSAGSTETTVTLNILDDWSDNTFTFLVNEVARSDGDTISVVSGVDVDFDCTVDNAVPSADVVLDFGGGDTETSTTATRAFTSATTVTCSGSNGGGSSSISVSLNLVVQACDCEDLMTNYGVTTSGEYTIWPDTGAGKVEMKAWCDMTTDGGGWTVFQRRQPPGTEDFFLDWADYKAGFPISMADSLVDVTGEFWLGNDNLYTLSNNMGKTYELRVDMNDGTQDICAVYDGFVIADENDKYRLTLGAYVASPSDGCTVAGDALTSRGAGEQFSTKDQDNDSHGSHCAQTYKGGWWYGGCHYANLNGLYKDPPGAYTGVEDGVCWQQWMNTHRFSMTTAEMKLRSPSPGVPL